MKSRIFPVVAFSVLLVSLLIGSSCGQGQANCPVCGTTHNGTVGLITVIQVPEHNPTGEPGGPFNIFDISWVDSVHHVYYVSDRVGLDVPIMDTVANSAINTLGGANEVAEAGNNASSCDPSIPPLMSAQGNFTRFACRNGSFILPGGFGPNGLFGGFMGAQCCASRANNVNPVSGPNGLEATPDGLTLFVGNGSSSVVVFDMTPQFASTPAQPTVIADIPTGTTPDYDGIPTTTNPDAGLGPCLDSANGRAFSDPTCGDLRADEMAFDSADQILLVANGDPSQPFITLIDMSGVVGRTSHCLPVSATSPYSPKSATFPNGNFPTCILGQIYYDGTSPVDNTVTVDDAVSSCPFPSLNFPTAGFPSVPSGVSGRNARGVGVDVACHHGPVIRTSNGQFCPTATSFADCAGAISPAGIGGSVFNPRTGHFLVSNANSTGSVPVGSIDEINPLTPNGPVVINSFPVIGCMPSGVVVGPGTDILVTCENHDGRTFPPTEIIMNGTNGTILATIPFVGGVDEGWYNPGDNRYYLAARDMANGPVLGVIDAGSRLWLQNVPTNSNSHSVAADPANNHVFVPLAAGGVCGTQSRVGCVGVYASQ